MLKIVNPGIPIILGDIVHTSLPSIHRLGRSDPYSNNGIKPIEIIAIPIIRKVVLIMILTVEHQFPSLILKQRQV